MFICPNCKRELIPTETRKCLSHACTKCGGRALRLASLGRATLPEAVRRLKTLLEYGRGRPGKPCPVCSRSMLQIDFTEAHPELEKQLGIPSISKAGVQVRGPLWLDCCRPCSLVWFDRGEIDALPDSGRTGPSEIQELTSGPAEISFETGPADPFEELAGWFDLPNVVDSPDRPNRVWITGTLILLSFAFTGMGLRSPQFMRHWAFIPDQPFRDHGLTLLTYAFLHAGFWHFFGNMYFLYQFGRGVEGNLEDWEFLLLFFGAAATGALVHAHACARPEVPLIGASAGISGVIMFFALSFPRASVQLLFAPYFGMGGTSYGWLRLSVWLFMVGWLAEQIWVSLQQLAGLTEVSGLSHLGGILFGFVFWLLLGTRSVAQVSAPDSV